MLETLMPIAVVVLLWWVSTGAVLWLARGMDSQMYPRLILATILCALGFAGVVIASAHSEVWSVYLAFVSTLAIWGWIEFTFLAGLITGSDSTPCPPNISEGRRFAMAFKIICHHEYTLAAVLVIMAILDSNTGSGMAFKTFALLWIMRLGTKISIFSGVPGISVEMIPDRLSYMKSYFRLDRVSSAFWVSAAGCTLFFLAGLYALSDVNYNDVTRTEVIILTTLVGLALLEHAFMVLPIQDSKLWHWAMGGKQASKPVIKTKSSKLKTSGFPHKETGSV